MLLSGLPRSVARKAEIEQKRLHREAYLRKAGGGGDNPTSVSALGQPMNRLPSLQLVNPNYQLEPIISNKNNEILMSAEERRAENLKQYLNSNKVKSIQSAHESMTRIAGEKNRLNTYVDSEAFVQDDFFMYACMSGLREAGSVESSSVVANFRKTILDRRSMTNLKNFRALLDQGTNDDDSSVQSQQSDASSDVDITALTSSFEPLTQQSSFVEKKRNSKVNVQKESGIDISQEEPDARPWQTLPPFAVRKPFGVKGEAGIAPQPNPIKVAADAASMSSSLEPGGKRSNKLARQREKLAALRRNIPVVAAAQTM